MENDDDDGDDGDEDGEGDFENILVKKKSQQQA